MMCQRRLLSWRPIAALFLLALPFTFTFIILAPVIPASAHNTTGSVEAQEIPAGFYPVSTGSGVALYRKDYPGGNPDYMQVVDLSRGGRVSLRHAGIADPGSSGGAYGGANPTFSRELVVDAWDIFRIQDPNAFCITNGAFFSTDANPAPLAFPLKVDGAILSDGYAGNEYPDQKLMLELWEEQADIRPLTLESLYTSQAPHILGGLSEDADKSPEEYLGRTFAGVLDGDLDGTYEIVLIFNSQTTRQADAARVLRNFGAEKVIMLDGGASTQLTCLGTPHIGSLRPVPQFLAVSSQPVTPYSVEVESKPFYPVLVEGENLLVEISLHNTGYEVWHASEVQLVNIRNPLGADERQWLPRDVLPGDTVQLSWLTQTFDRWGVHTSEWMLSRGGEPFAGEEVTFTLIVIPKELEDERRELEAQIRQWAEEQMGDLEDLIREWIRQQGRNLGQKIADWASDRIQDAFSQACASIAGLIPLGLMVMAVRKRRMH
jgi:Phosphodiester glycosidase